MENENDILINTVEMHTSGEQVRIVISGIPEPVGSTMLEKKEYTQKYLDKYRKMLMHEPRGHKHSYGVIIVKPVSDKAHFGILYMDTHSYASMCGHATISTARYAVEKGLVGKNVSDLLIDAPCGLLRVHYDQETKFTSFLSVPSFVYERNVKVKINGFDEFTVDISYGGSFYAIVEFQQLNLISKQTTASQIRQIGKEITAYLKKTYTIKHPMDDKLSYLYGTLICDQFQDDWISVQCVFGGDCLDRSPCGSGTTARSVQLYDREKIKINQRIISENILTKGKFFSTVIEETKCGKFSACIVRIEGQGFFTGTAQYTKEASDELGAGFLLE